MAGEGVGIPPDDDGVAGPPVPALYNSRYTPELAAEIVEAVSLTARSLSWLCEQNPHWPCPATIWSWKASKPEFRNAFNEGRRHLADELAFQAVEIADDGSGDAKLVERRDGSQFVVQDQEFAARSKLRTEVRRWLASKLAPETYGDRLDATVRLGAILSQEDALDQLR